MPKHLVLLVTLLALAGPGLAQEDAADDPAGDVEPPASEAAAPTDDDAPAADEDDDAIDDSDLDEQTYEEDDDGFIPTEEIPADEPIPFPSNI